MKAAGCGWRAPTPRSAITSSSATGRPTGAVRSSGGEIQFHHNLVAANQADNGSGTLFQDPVLADLHNNVVIDNSFNGVVIVGGMQARVRFNTLAGNGVGQGGEAIALDNVATAEVRANALRNNHIGLRVSGGTQVTLVRNSLWANQGDYAGIEAGPSDLRGDPRHANGPLGSFYLSNVAAGQPSNSPLIDASGITVHQAGLQETTTRTDGAADQGMADIGSHYVSVTGTGRVWLPIVRSP
ncbi:MAG: hypothetical protein HZY76_14205 [Anaerolineae bacterium]|nr:MAG: hypothetical protein HZY76_14205 [Anaerolineae bacterium]